MFNRYLSLNIWRPLVSDSLSLNVTTLDETAYFSVRILYSSIMSPLRRRYAKVGNFSFFILNVFETRN